MCPVCWTTALAMYTALLAASALPVAGTDRWTITGAAVLALLSVGQWMRWLDSPWWALVLLAGLLLARIVYLMVRAADRLLITRLWHVAVARTQRVCPRKLMANATPRLPEK